MPPARASCPPPVARADLHRSFSGRSRTSRLARTESATACSSAGTASRRRSRPAARGRGPSAIDRRVRDGHAGHRAGRAPAHARDVRPAASTWSERRWPCGALRGWGPAERARAGRTGSRRQVRAMAAGTSHCCQCRRPIHSKVFRSQGAPPITPRAISSSRAATAASARRVRSPSPRQRARPPARRSAAAAGSRCRQARASGTRRRRTRRREGPRWPATRTSRRLQVDGRSGPRSACRPPGGPGG